MSEKKHEISAPEKETWQRVQAIFERVLHAPATARAAVLEEACGEDAALRAEVVSLLEHDSKAGDEFLSSPVSAIRPVQDGPSEWARALVGQKIGRYTLVRMIASGGMGCVFEAMQERPARAVALKILRPGCSGAAALARFRLEPEVLARLQHPNIAQVYEAGVHEDERGAIPYFAMELIPDAQPLIDHAQAHRLNTRERLGLFAKVCDGVHHGHQKGIIHRDIKPENILVGRDGAPKIIDFGVARATDADILLTTQCTQVGELVGTVQYMSPEQCDGDPAAIDTRTDIYSLGVVLYELLTGAAPYPTSGKTIYAAVRVIKEVPPRPPREIDGRLSRDLEAILLKSLEKDPARRYASAADLAQDLHRHLDGQPVEARAPGPWPRLLRWAGRHPRTAAVVSTLVVCGLIAAGVLLTLQAYVRYMLFEPVHVELTVDRTKAELISRQGTVLHDWSGAPGRIRVAQLVKFDPNNVAPTHVLVGYDAQCPPDRKGQLHLYDLAGDRDVPVRTWQLALGDLPRDAVEHNYAVEQFQPVDAWVWDVFPDGQGLAQHEIVCKFSHNMRSWRALCIFGADGELLYRIWNDGEIFNCYWMAGPERLLVAAENQAVEASDLGCSTAPTPGKPLVVFALRPRVGSISTSLLDPSTAGGASLAWYKWLDVCPIPDTSWAWSLGPPREQDPARAAQLSMQIDATSPCAISWCIDAEGNPIPRSRIGPTYERVRATHPALPALEEFRLSDDPPGGAASDQRLDAH